MSYIGQQLPADVFSGFTTDTFTGNNSDTTFTLSKAPFSEDGLIVVINNVIQQPTVNFTVSGTTLTIVGTAVATGDVIYAIHTSGAVPSTLASKVDVNGLSDGVILDADADTTISADTDDQIDVKIGGTDALTVTGTALTGNAVATIGATGTASTIAGIPFFSDSSNKSMYTHDVSGTDSTAAGNTAFGFTAMDAITTGDDNTAMGENAMGGLQDGVENVAIGKNSMLAATSASQNTCVGLNSGTALTSGSGYNVLLGHGAGAAMTTGNRNIAIGVSAMDGFDTEAHNLGIGISSLGGSVAGGEYNVGVGNYTLDAVTSGDNNVAVGYNALTAVGSGYDNVAVGFEALVAHTDGQGMTCVGYRAGQTNTTGGSNICIGRGSDVSGSNNANSIALGINIGASSNQFRFGKSGAHVSNSFDSNANFSQASDERKKKNIKDQKLGLDFINELRTVSYNWKPSNEFPKEWDSYSETNEQNLDVTMHGMIAQEVKAAIDKHADETDKKFNGWSEDTDGMQNLSREMFVIPLIKAVQELAAKVKALEDA